MYSATWIDGKANYTKQSSENWGKSKSPMKVALKRLNGSRDISAKYLNEVFYLI